MILFAKHLALMSLGLLLVPLLGRLYAQYAGAQRRFKRPGISPAVFFAQLIIALLVPLLAQGLFEWIGVRWFSLAAAGAVYGALFGDDQDFPLIPSVLWGVLGGLGAAYCFYGFPISSEARSLSVAVFAVAPLLAYRHVTINVRGRVGSGGLITPSRRILR